MTAESHMTLRGANIRLWDGAQDLSMRAWCEYSEMDLTSWGMPSSLLARNVTRPDISISRPSTVWLR